jgi:hypothetical protein
MQIYRMETYRDRDGDSGINGFEIAASSITVLFNTGKTYSYSYKRAGIRHVENMKVLARQGDGLNAYINKNVRKLYD